MSECVECESNPGTVRHHVQYDPEVIVMLCASCHGKVHSDETHEYHPADSVPDGFKRYATANVTETTLDRLHEAKHSRKESINDVIVRLLDAYEHDDTDESESS